jgi:hypothetical protein
MSWMRLWFFWHVLHQDSLDRPVNIRLLQGSPYPACGQKLEYYLEERIEGICKWKPGVYEEKCRPSKEYSEKNQNSSHIELKGQALE